MSIEELKGNAGKYSEKLRDTIVNNPDLDTDTAELLLNQVFYALLNAKKEGKLEVLNELRKRIEERLDYENDMLECYPSHVELIQSWIEALKWILAEIDKLRTKEE